MWLLFLCDDNTLILFVKLSYSGDLWGGVDILSTNGNKNLDLGNMVCNELKQYNKLLSQSRYSPV